VLIAGPATAGDLKDELVAFDKALWAGWDSGDATAFKEHLTDDHVQAVAGAGIVHGKDKIIAGLDPDACEVQSFDFQEINLRQLTDDVVLLSYVATQDAACGGAKLPPKVYATSVYVRRDGKWLSAAYQETPLP
jgi:uncharacterized protein (TIGR02246 family)